MTDGLEIPDKLSEWTKGGIVEHIGSDEEHTDTFYRHGNLGAEQDKDGTWEAYTIVDGHPIKVKGDMMSFEEVVEFFKGSFCSKRLADSDDEDDESDDFDEDEDFDEDDEPEHPQGDDEIGVTFILKSISEMMDEGYDGNAVRKASNPGDSLQKLRQADGAAGKTRSGKQTFRLRGESTSPVTRTHTRSGRTTLDYLYEMNPRLIQGALGGGFHTDRAKYDPTAFERKDEKGKPTEVGFGGMNHPLARDNQKKNTHEEAGTGKSAYQNFIKRMFGAKDVKHLKNAALGIGGGLKPIDPKYGIKESEVPMPYTMADVQHTVRGPYNDLPVITDDYTIAQINDLIKRFYAKGHGQQNYDLDVPVVAGVDPTMLDLAYQRFTEDDLKNLGDESKKSMIIDPETGKYKPIPVKMGDSREALALNPKLFTYGTKRSLHPMNLGRIFQRVREDMDEHKKGKMDTPLVKTLYDTAGDLEEFLAGVDNVGKLSDGEYNEIYEEALKGIPVRELLKFLQGDRYAYLRRSSPRVYRGPSEPLMDVGVTNALYNNADPAIQAMLKYVEDNPLPSPRPIGEKNIDDMQESLLDTPHEIYYPYQRAIRQLFDNLSPRQRRELLKSGFLDERLLPIDMVNRGAKKDLEDFKVDFRGESTKPTSEDYEWLLKYDPSSLEDAYSKQRLFEREFGSDALPPDYLNKQLEYFDKFHEDFAKENGRVFNPEVDLSNEALKKRYYGVKDAADNYRKVREANPTDELLELYKLAEISYDPEKERLGESHIAVEHDPQLVRGDGLNHDAEYTLQRNGKGEAKRFDLRNQPVLGPYAKDDPLLNNKNLNPENTLSIWHPQGGYPRNDQKHLPHANLRRNYALLAGRALRSGIPIPEGLYNSIRKVAAQDDSEWDKAFAEDPQFFVKQNKILTDFYNTNEGSNWKKLYTLLGSKVSSPDELAKRRKKIDAHYDNLDSAEPENKSRWAQERHDLHKTMDQYEAELNSPKEPSNTIETGEKDMDETINKSMMKSISVMIMEQMFGDLTEPCDQEPNLEILNEYPRSIIMGAGKVAIPDPQHVTAHDVYRTYSVKNFPENFPGNGE